MWNLHQKQWQLEKFLFYLWLLSGVCVQQRLSLGVPYTITMFFHIKDIIIKLFKNNNNKLVKLKKWLRQVFPVIAIDGVENAKHAVVKTESRRSRWNLHLAPRWNGETTRESSSEFSRADFLFLVTWLRAFFPFFKVDNLLERGVHRPLCVVV